MKYAVVTFPGSNCDWDTYYAVKDVMKEEVDMLWHGDNELGKYDCIILPGGFSYGDYLRAGAIAKFSPLMKEIINYANAGGLIIGICNGFQILLETNLLPGAMLQNKNVHFICKQVYVKLNNSNTPFTNAINKNDVLNIPIAHMDGNYYCDIKTYKELEENGQILFKYSDSNGNISDNANPNGSLANIAGICNAKKNVFGLMPHPERAVEKILGSEDGKKIFLSIRNHILQSKN
ncbi:MAG: phosphoribosylformylglycinamidine synthase subunit PurQ [Spirochaetota bacterium]|nr:phosphoribosylformylglycinamidine synthase subunit PurQ [Spirochaetota bacterium]